MGERLSAFWQNLAAGGIQAIVVLVTPYAGAATRWLVAQAGGLGALMLQFLLTVIAAAALYARGEGGRLGAALRRAAGRRPGRARDPAVRPGDPRRRTGRGGHRIAQTMVGGIGLAIAGIRSRRC